MGSCQCKDKHVDSNQVIIQRKPPDSKSAKNGEATTEKTIILFKSKPGTKAKAIPNENAQENNIVNNINAEKSPSLMMADKSQEIIKQNAEQKAIASRYMDYKVEEMEVKTKEIEKSVEKVNEKPKSRVIENSNKIEENAQRKTSSNIANIKKPDRQKEKEEREKERERDRYEGGDGSFDYEYDNDDYGGGEDEEEIEIENTYFEADDKKNSSPKDAMEGFQTVIMLEENRSDKKYTFQSLLNIILIKCRLQLYEDLSGDVTKILKAMDKVSKNDANDAINSILEALLNLEDQNQADKAIVKILDYLKDKNYEQLWLNASIRLCKIYIDRKEYQQFQNLIESIKESCRLPDGSDDMKKSSVLLEVYSLEINLHMKTMNIPKIREIYEKTKNISSAIADPRTMGIIKDTHGKMLMIEKDWENARLELFEAFKFYQEVGNSRAKSALKYVVVSSILAQSGLNPFDNVEAKVYREDPEIKLMDNLRTAYEQKNGKELIKIMGTQKSKIFDEAFIQQFEEDLMNVICLEMIVALATPYKRMRFDYLERELNLSQKQVETYISRLILDKKLNGKIDLVDGFFENNNANRNEIEEKKNKHMYQWIKSLSGINAY